MSILRIGFLIIFAFYLALGQSQDEHLLILEKAQHLHKKENDIEGAIELLDSVWLTCKSETGATEECLKVLTYLAYYYRTSRKYDESLEHYLMMIEQDKEGDHHSKAYHFISQVLNLKRNHSLALDMAIKGYNHEKTDCRWKHNLSHNAAKSILYLGDSALYQQGLEWIDSSLIYYQQCGAGNPKIITNRLTDKGNLLLKMDKHTEAIEAYVSCNELLDNNGNNAAQKYRIYNNIGSSYSRLGNYKASIEYYQKSIDIYNEKEWNYDLENLSLLYRNMALISREQKDNEGALEWLKRSDKYLEDCLQSDSTLLAAIYRDKIRNKEEELSNYAESYLITNDRLDLDKAYRAGKDAFNRYLILRSMLFGDQTRMIGLQEIKYTVDQLVEICLDLGKDNEAFYICEKTKYLNLLEHLDHFDTTSISKVAAQLQLVPTTINDVRKIVGVSNQNDVYLEQEIEQFGHTLNQNDSLAIYSYYFLEDRYILFTHKNGVTQVEYLENAEKIDSLITIFLQVIKIRKPIDKLAQRLHTLLLPQREVVDTNILIVPHGHLAKLPFAALKKDNRFLITDIEINYKKSLLLPNSSYDSNQHMAIQPHYAGNKMNGKLPFAKGEADYLRNKFGFTVFQEDEATLEKLNDLDTELDIMHLIGHCTIDTENYRNSYFSLSKEQKWTPLDILNSTLRSNLLVLSACSTSDGEFDLEEGIRGISYIFNITGNNNQITTNWSIDDEANFTIFKSFYLYLNGKNTVGQALRLSQLDYLDNASVVLSHPYFWAGMRYEGDPSLKIKIAPEKENEYTIYFIGAILFLALYFVVRK